MYDCQSTDIERTVRSTQHSLTNYQFRNNGFEVLKVLVPKADHLTLITTLQLYLRFEDDYKHAVFLLEFTPSLVSLDIEALMDRPDAIFPSTPLAGGPRRLKSLRIECFSFESGGTVFFDFVKFEDLEELQLFFCRDYGNLLLELTHLPLKLKSFCIDEQDTRDVQFDDNTNIFLRSLKSLERISLALDPDGGYPEVPLDWRALETHASTLKYLRVETQVLNPLFPTKDCIQAFERLCDKAANLEQLAISGLSRYGGYCDDPDGKLGLPHFLVCPA
jgi:hypothetical protein